MVLCKEEMVHQMKRKCQENGSCSWSKYYSYYLHTCETEQLLTVGKQPHPCLGACVAIITPCHHITGQHIGAVLHFTM